MRIETPAEACAALAVLMVAADEFGTNEERTYLFDTVAELPIFASFDHDRFHQLMADTTQAIYDAFPTNGGRLSSEGVGRLVELICAALPAAQRVEALQAAAGLAQSDGIVSMEALLLQRLCEGLEIDAESTSRLLGPLA